MIEKLICIVSDLIHEMREERGHDKKILHRLDLIMSKISDFAAAQKAFNDAQGASIDSLVTSTAGLVADVQSLNDKITELQNSAGGVTPEDQALIDQLQTQGAALSDRLTSAATALAALDAQTPPVVPVP
jgi:uncharacterized protein YdcH (DUF465 family)